MISIGARFASNRSSFAYFRTFANWPIGAFIAAEASTLVMTSAYIPR